MISDTLTTRGTLNPKPLISDTLTTRRNVDGDGAKGMHKFRPAPRAADEDDEDGPEDPSRPSESFSEASSKLRTSCLLWGASDRRVSAIPVRRSTNATS